MRNAEGDRKSNRNITERTPENRRRSQRVLLEVAVLIRFDLPGGKQGQAQAFTSSVNAHGGLLECAIRIKTGQKITLVNPRTKKEVGSRVVRSDGSPESSFTIAFEFDLPNTQFWSIAFPPSWDAVLSKNTRNTQ